MDGVEGTYTSCCTCIGDESRHSIPLTKKTNLEYFSPHVTLTIYMQKVICISIMRYSHLALVAAGFCARVVCRNILTSAIRPHGRALIQSITAKPRPSHVDEFKRSMIQNDEFCQPASTFVTKDGNSEHEYHSKHVESTKKAVEQTREFLQDMETTTRTDGVRLATQMDLIWRRTIMDELELLSGAVADKVAEYATHSTNAGKLNDKEGERIPSPTQQFPVSGPKSNLFSLSESEHSLSGKVGAGPLIGVMSHPAGAWAKMQSSYDTAGAQLNTLKVTLTSLQASAAEFMATHLEYVKSDKGFNLKWDKATKLDDLKFADVPQALLAAEAYAPSAGSSSDAFDGFTDSSALGHAVIVAVRGGSNFDDFITATSGSPSETMDRLTTTLNVLQVRRLGLADAKRSLLNLLGLVKDLMIKVREGFTGSLTKIVKDLDDLKDKANYVYLDAAKFPGVKIEADQADSDADVQLETHLTELKAFVGSDAHGELGPRINLIVNVLRRLHGHLYAFVAAHQDSVPAGEDPSTKVPTADGMAGITTKLMTVPEIIEKSFFLPTGGATAGASDDAPAPVVDVKAAEGAIREARTNSRKVSECLLYGRIDSLLKREKSPNVLTEGVETASTDADLCSATHAAGGAIMKELFKPAPLAAVTPAHLAAGDGELPHGEGVDGARAAVPVTELADAATIPAVAPVTGTGEHTERSLGDD